MDNNSKKVFRINIYLFNCMAHCIELYGAICVIKQEDMKNFIFQQDGAPPH